MERTTVETWLAAYERAWRTPGTERLAEVFTADVSYSPSPWAPVLYGLEALAEFWDAERVSADEPFAMRSGIVAIDRDTTIVRVEVDYEATGSQWRDLWVVEIDGDGRCRAFEEWPFAPTNATGTDDVQRPDRDP